MKQSMIVAKIRTIMNVSLIIADFVYFLRNILITVKSRSTVEATILQITTYFDLILGSPELG
jgi:hypothetical protein